MKDNERGTFETTLPADGLIQPFSVGLLSAINESGLSPYELAKRSGIPTETIGLFIDHKRSLLLKSADKLAIALRLRVARVVRAKRPQSKATLDPGPQPFSTVLRTAMSESGMSANAMATESGLHSYSIRQFLAGESFLNLESADILADIFRLKVIHQTRGTNLEPESRNGDPSQGFSAVLRAAIIESGRSIYALAKDSGVHHFSIRQFIGYEQSLSLETADKLADVLGLRVIRPEREAPDNHSSRHFPAILRLAITDSGLSASVLAKLSGLRAPMIRRFIAGEQDIKYLSAIKLANALESKLILVSSKARAAGASAPVELRGEGFPIRLHGKELPSMKGDPYRMLEWLVEGFRKGRKVPASELSALSESGRIRPLIEALDRPGFQQLRIMIRESKEGRNKYLEIVDAIQGD